MGRILAIDPGSRRLGLAMTDPGRVLAQPLEVLAYDQPKKALAELRRLIDGEGVDLIVIGLPLSLSGAEGEAVRRARKLADKLRRQTGLEVVEWDERLTTVGAARAMREGGVDSRGQRGVVDKVAAALLLQSYLQAVAPPLAGAATEGTE